MNVVRLINLLGRELLAYLCACGPDDLPGDFEDVSIEDVTTLNPRQQGAMREIAEMVVRRVVEPLLDLPYAVVARLDPSGPVLANVLHVRAGGRLPAIATDDALLAPLLAIATDGMSAWMNQASAIATF